MPPTLSSRNLTIPEPSQLDRDVSLIAWGFTIGFGYLTAWKGYKQTSRIPKSKRYKSMYFWLVWLEVVSVLGYGCLTWLHVQNYAPPTFVLFFGIWFFWMVQSHTQPQIIINRIAVIIDDKRKTTLLRRAVFVLNFILCAISAVLWIGGSLQINDVFLRGDNIYTRVEGVCFLSVDVFLNIYFIKCVKKHLLEPGLEKYKPLVKFVFRIITISLALDLVVLGMMSYTNPRMWLQLHPLGLIVKLNIELSMAALIAKLARKNTFRGSLELSQISTNQDQTNRFPTFCMPIQPEMQSTSESLDSAVTKPQEVVLNMDFSSNRNIADTSDKSTMITYEHDERPLPEEREWDRNIVRRQSQLSYS